MPKSIKPIIKKYDISKEELEKRVADIFEKGVLFQNAEEKIKSYKIDEILKGQVITITKDEIAVDIGYKSEGVIFAEEFEDGEMEQYEIGQVLEVIIEDFNDETGVVILSRKRAERLRNWENIINKYKEGDEVTGQVLKKIKGGLLVDIGIPVFLPASQVSIRRTKDISEYIGQELTCEIIKIDEERMNIVVSRRRLIEKMREKMKKALLSEIKEGEIRDGIVKNIADFGAFVDLGGIDGLLHITDMSWGRITHPSEMLQVDQKIEVYILSIDRDRERIALSLKHKTPSPWENIEERFPEGAKVKGTIVNVMNYGAFVKLDEGIEGLVHVSEMSWSKRITNPAEVVSVGSEVEVMVLSVNAEKQEISLGMKQASTNPWDIVEEKYPKGTKIKGHIKHLTNYGAFVEIEEGLEGLLHVSDMSWTRKISHPKEVVSEGDPIETVVLSIDKEKKRIALGLKQMAEDPWDEYIPSKYLVGSNFRGTISKIANFGVFVELEPSLEGLLHVSELGLNENATSEDIEKVIQPGYKLDVRVIRIDEDERKIGLALSVPIDEQKFEGDESAIPNVEKVAVANYDEPQSEEEHTGNGFGSVLAQAIENSKTAREEAAEEKAEEAKPEEKPEEADKPAETVETPAEEPVANTNEEAKEEEKEDKSE